MGFVRRSRCWAVDRGCRRSIFATAGAAVLVTSIVSCGNGGSSGLSFPSPSAASGTRSPAGVASYPSATSAAGSAGGEPGVGPIAEVPTASSPGARGLTLPPEATSPRASQRSINVSRSPSCASTSPAGPTPTSAPSASPTPTSAPPASPTPVPSQSCLKPSAGGSS